jgi:hypothetical protein
MATREEHLAYVDGLLAKDADNSINEAEAKALATYRRRYIRDAQGGLDVDGRRVVRRGTPTGGSADYYYGALFVSDCAESKKSCSW